MDNQPEKAADVLFKEISEDAKYEMINKSRWTVESYWMMAMVMNAGWDTANQINQDVCEKLGLVEMRRLMKAMNLGLPKNNEEFMILLKLAMDSFLTQDYFDYEFITSAQGKSVAVIHHCYSNTKLRKVGAQDQYQCGCFKLRAGWYKAINTEVEEKLLKCLIKGDDRCEIMIENINILSNEDDT